MLFHVSYYPLFAVLLLPVLRRDFGLTAGLVVTAALFALYHLAGFYYFPAGVTLRLQVLLFASFAASLLLYLWTENLILVAMTHNVGGSVGLAVNGTLFNQVDELLVVTLLLMAGLAAYMIVFEVRHRTRVHRDGWWLSVQTENQAC
jgi:membrane protease YdiL (CAAX protease family)